MRRSGRHWIIWIADPVRMHGAVQVDSRDPVTMRFENPLHLLLVRYVRCAFIVNDHVKTFGIIRVAQNRQRRMRGRIIGVNLLDDDIRPLRQAILQNILLVRVVMTAAPGDQQRPNRVGRLHIQTGRGEGKGKKAVECCGIILSHKGFEI